LYFPSFRWPPLQWGGKKRKASKGKKGRRKRGGEKHFPLFTPDLNISIPNLTTKRKKSLGKKEKKKEEKKVPTWNFTSPGFGHRAG